MAKANLQTVRRRIRSAISLFRDMPGLLRDLRWLREVVRHQHFEIIFLKMELRRLASGLDRVSNGAAATGSSFDFQWREIPDGLAMLNDPIFRVSVCDDICTLTGHDSSWFVGKNVVDLGCGEGRFSFGFAKLGADVTAVDQSKSGLEFLARTCNEAGLAVRTVRHDILTPIQEVGSFDLVWCYGVLHHTGDTCRAFMNAAKLVRPGGELFVMIYAEPDLANIDDFREIAEYNRLRLLTWNMTFEDKIEALRHARPDDDVHAWFDAISPRFNDLYTSEEITEWFKEAGFDDVRRMSDKKHHHLIARKRER